MFSAKHFINNEQEHFRDLGSSNVDNRYVATVSDSIPLIPSLVNQALSTKYMLRHSSKASLQVWQP